MSRTGYQPDPQMLKDFLESYTVPILKRLAALLTSGLPTRKAELVALIQQHLENPDTLRKLWAELNDLQRAAVAEVVHAWSEFDGTRFRAKYGRDPDWGKFSQWGEMEKPSPLCLFIYNAEMPRDLKERLKRFVPPPRAAQISGQTDAPTTIPQTWHEYDHKTGSHKTHIEEIEVFRCETEHVAQHDLQAVLRLIDAGKVRVSDKTKQVTAAGARAITEVLLGGDFYPPEKESDAWTTEPGPMRAFAWPLILQSAGLANLSGAKLQLTPAGKKALTSPPHQVIREAWKRWLKSTLLDEFNRVHTIKGQTGQGKRQMTAVAGRRTAIVDALRACSPHQWIAFDEFSRFMQAAGHTFEVSRDLWTLYISDRNYGSLGYSGFGDWRIVQGRYAMAFLFEYAATLGVIDVAYIHPSGARSDYGELWGTDDLDCLSRYDGLMHIRINGLGAYCLGLTEEYVPTPLPVKQVLKVLPTMDVVATEPLPPGDVLVLEQFSEQTSDVVWKIETSRLLKAVEEGRAVADIVAFLQAKSGESLPGAVTIFFNEAAERAKRLVNRGPALLIEAQDAALAQLIANDSRLRSLCMLAGERHIVVPADAESAFRRALRELGYTLPAQSRP